ncbi:hypothetical protein [Pontibacter cellulosilyticus]|uniref:DUF3352 domain-containing protein n=1 Tax=Pontibacter cellulosilyticus TaxID=1720253 RepID=A0A923SJ21_9BACT|nr:hypothetical protein [Pontibacter cellulosilyticus]MBC5993202.1 hypothetical protein [Pontibacter cellulosilyticus]
MPKRIVFYFIGFVVLASLAYYGFNRWKDSREKVDLWAMVPENAAFVVETNNHLALVEHLRETNLLESFSALAAYQRFEENMAYLDSVSPGTQRRERFLDKKNILTSIHVVGKTDVEFVHYIPVNSVGEHRFLRTLTENISKSEFFEQDSRQYQGTLLNDITNTRLGTSFTYFTYHNNIILSRSPVLVEEIVRRITRGNPTSVAAKFKSTNYLNQPEVYANVFINYRELPNVLGLFLKEDLMPQVRYLSSLSESAMLELKLEQDKIFLNGFSEPETLKNSFHSNIAPVKPQPMGVKNYLPNRTAVLLHFGLDKVVKLKRQPAQKEAAGSAYGATIDSLAQVFNNEVALAYMESNTINASPEKVVFAHVGNAARAQSLIKQLNQKVLSPRKKKPYTEKYGGYTIEMIEVPELPAKLFGSLFTGFEQSYVVEVDDYIIFSDEVAALRDMLDDISAENVWGKSVAQKGFIEETLQEANFSLYLNTVNAWYVLSRYMTDNSREDLLQNATLIKRFNQVSFQFANTGKQYYTSFVFRKQDRSATSGEDLFVTELTEKFDTRISSKPFPIQNAVDRSREIVVQDSADVLINITATGKRGWADTVGTSIRGGIKQIEFGPENKLRYLFATGSRIHAINNQGQSLENFPFNIGDTLNIQHLAVFDYEKNQDYRLLIDDNLGNLYMYDIRGNAIEGWQPRRMDYRLATEPQHLRVGGRDVILVLLENGYVYALNKRGETYPGFPINLKSPLTSGAFINAGADLRKTEVTVVTKYGSVATFNLQGKLLNREQLERPSKGAFFNLLPEENNGKSYIIVRQEQGRVAIFDQDLNLQFEKRYVTSAPKIVQYFHFGGDNKVYAVTETGPQKTYLYTSKGKLVGNTTLENSKPVVIYRNEATNDYTLYKVFRKELQKISFRLVN